MRLGQKSVRPANESPGYRTGVGRVSPEYATLHPEWKRSTTPCESSQCTTGTETNEAMPSSVSTASLGP